MKKIFIIVLAVLLTGAISAKALEYFRGTPEEIKQVQNDVFGFEAIDGNKVNTGGYFRENLLPLNNNTYDVGSSALKFKDGYFAGNLDITGTLTSGALSLAGNILPSASATYDLGSAALQWDELWVGTLHATIAADINEDLTIGDGSTTTTLTVGTRGNATSTLYSDLSVVNRDVVIGGSATSGWLWVGDGTATTSIRGGTAGSVSSTLEGDTIIANLFSGTNIFDTDAGMVDAMDLPVSASAATGTLEGYNFPIDGKPLMSLVSKSDAQGTVWAGYTGIGTQTPSSTLHVANDFMGINNTATTTVTIGSDRMSPGCIKIQDTDRLGWSYLTVINGVGTWSQTSCE